MSRSRQVSYVGRSEVPPRIARRVIFRRGLVSWSDGRRHLAPCVEVREKELCSGGDGWRKLLRGLDPWSVGRDRTGLWTRGARVTSDHVVTKESPVSCGNRVITQKSSFTSPNSLSPRHSKRIDD